MVVVKPPSYQTGPVNRNSGTLSLGRAALYLVLCIGLIYVTEHYQYNKGLRGEASAAVKVSDGSPKAATEVKAAAVEPPPAPEPKPFVAEGKICERNIGVNLGDNTKWPTPFTPSYFDKEPESDEAVLVVGGGAFGNTLLVALFHAIDLAYDKKCSVMIVKDADYIWDHVSKWFYGGKPRDDAFYKSMEDAFDIKVVDSITAASGLKKELHKVNSQSGLYTKSTTLDASKIRNRRETIYRKLFSLGQTAPCDSINKLGLNKADAKYTVIDVAVSDPWNKKFDGTSGRDHTHAYDMKPDYVKSILSSINMQDSPVYLGKTNGGADANRAEVTSLINDPGIKTNDGDVTNDLYMAVLADCFIGFPASHWSMMVARMRYALGMKNTFVLTQKIGEVWKDYVNEDNHLVIHDPDKMGLWLG